MRAIPEPGRSKPQGQSFVAFAHAASSFPFGWHYHPEFELTYIEAGTGLRYVGDSIQPFHPGDLVLLGGNLPHTWSSENRRSSARSHRTIVVHFPAELFRSAAPEFQAIQDLLRESRRGLVFAPAIAAGVLAQLRKLPRLRGLPAWCGLAALLHTLANAGPSEALASPGYAPSLRPDAQRRLERIFHHIETRAFASDLGLTEIARLVHLSPAALSRFFRQMTGRTLISHIQQTRIGMACRKLTDSDQSIAEIAFSCGFDNLANFNRQFRAIQNMTPSEFRKCFEHPVRSAR